MCVSALAQIAKLSRPGLAALAGVAKRRAALHAYHLGFVFGPRINAGGRVGRSSLGADLLTTREAESGWQNLRPSSICTIGNARRSKS